MKKFIVTTVIVIITATLLIFAAPISAAENTMQGGYGYGYGSGLDFFVDLY